MCFRPAEADAASGVHPTKCANCGKTVFPTEGLLPKKCPFYLMAIGEMEATNARRS